MGGKANVFLALSLVRLCKKIIIYVISLLLIPFRQNSLLLYVSQTLSDRVKAS